jgi:hypothetical protein
MVEPSIAIAPNNGSTRPTEAEENNVIVVDVGKKQRRKAIRQLRRGRGRLMAKIKDALDDMKEQGVMPENAQPVVFVVRQRSRGPRFGF